MRAVEQADGSWLPRFGSVEFPIQPDEAAALEFLVAAAVALGGRHLFQLYVHRRDGSIATRAASDPLPDELDARQG